MNNKRASFRTNKNTHKRKVKTIDCYVVQKPSHNSIQFIIWCNKINYNINKKNIAIHLKQTSEQANEMNIQKQFASHLCQNKLKMKSMILLHCASDAMMWNKLLQCCFSHSPTRLVVAFSIFCLDLSYTRKIYVTCL